VSEHQHGPRIVDRAVVDAGSPVWRLELLCQHLHVHVSVTRVASGEQPIETATIVGEEMHRWLQEADGFQGMLIISREGTSLGLTFWESRELAERQRTARMSFLERIMSVANVEVEEVVDYEVTFARLGPMTEPT
jgi:hypothetical protein